MSATPLPILRGTSTALYPFTQTYVCSTGISDSQSASPTRWVKAPPLVRFEFPYRPVNQADKNKLKSFFNSAKGQFSAGFSAGTDITYNNLSFDADEFSAVEQNNTIYSTKWSLSQALSQNFSPGVSGGAYPTLANGTICQLPYTQKLRFQTITSKVESGPKYSYPEFGSGLTNFPAGGLMAWQIGQARLIDADVVTLVAHFLANWGNCFPFTFTDESDATSATSVPVAAGTYTLSTQAGLISYPPGGLIYLVSRSTGAQLWGSVVSYDSISSLVIDVAFVTGSGTKADWSISPTYPNVYYASNELTIQHNDFENTSISTGLIQMN